MRFEPYRPTSPPNRNTRGVLIFAGVLGGMFAGGYGGYVGYAVDSHWGNGNAVKGVTACGLAGGVLGGLAVWKLTR